VALALAAGSAGLAVPGVASADAPSGAIFTTLPDGSAVNFNIYGAKEDVYLDGGPGFAAPQGAAGLDDGTYVFQVTEPSGKTLLSTDEARCRQFTVAAGIITGVVATGCEHVTGLDVDHGAVTVQLMPYLDTPNNGGEYKVHATRVADFLAGCAELGVADGLSVVDCGYSGGNFHGFVPAHSKTDNFKVRVGGPREIDTRFFTDRDNNGIKGNDEPWIDGNKITWTDTNGSSNTKWSHKWMVYGIFEVHEAHVEAVEDGAHLITIADQAGCSVGKVTLQGTALKTSGPQSVLVRVNGPKTTTYRIDVACKS
jgi:hypothetical protein